jgi:SAM-dependent methyltransferase
VGFNCLESARRYPTATIVGLEPDDEAVMVGHAMARQEGLNVAFVVAKGECLPFRDGAFDLIICHTVIEHVQDVALVVTEMARVLAPEGAIHLEAPNYLWPREPHLEIWCVPCLGKITIRLLARLQGKGRFIWYLDHLQLVTPRLLERLFEQHHLVWEDRTLRKLRMIADGQVEIVKAYRGLARALQILRPLGVARRLVEAAAALRLYPSVQYTVSRVRPPNRPEISS